ncbi:hypothetical protein [Puniceibacterium sp. IMCC21224]|uniref:hypothetical protein n=1 Tax=Puniceibacterium sp. IMCC21224 TaxID=1618204 RepID=UPI00064D7D54|nr:hypothetical protein [Puniceibacterium sp. IMCC21224]KMK68292.1 hypothetical protein IMCC21224_113173 [Puniceibacterium sp. IMCC21224]
MAEFEKIEDREQLANWLKNQDMRMSRMIAARSSLRSLPAVMAVVDQKSESWDGKDSVLSCLRATLISGVASTCPTPDMKRVETAAATVSAAFAIAVVPTPVSTPASTSAAFATASAAADAATTFATASAAAAAAASASADAVDDAAAAARSAIYQDAEQGQRIGSLGVFNQVLWTDVEPVQKIVSKWDRFSALPDPDGVWVFWRDWYRSMLHGDPMNWDLQLQVALIEDEVWNAGPKAVAAKIKSIQRQRVILKTAISETVVYDDDSGVYRLERAEVTTSDALEFCVERVSVALSRAIREGRGNGLRDDSLEAEILRDDAFAPRKRTNASAVALAFADARQSLLFKIGDYTYPDLSSYNLLANTLWAGKEEICGFDAKAKERCALYDALETPKHLSPELRVLLDAVPDEVPDMVDPELAEALERSARHVTEADTPPRGDTAKLAHRLLKMRETIDDVVQRADGSTGYKAAKFAQFLYKVSDGLIGLFS